MAEHFMSCTIFCTIGKSEYKWRIKFPAILHIKLSNKAIYFTPSAFSVEIPTIFTEEKKTHQHFSKFWFFWKRVDQHDMSGSWRQPCNDATSTCFYLQKCYMMTDEGGEGIMRGHDVWQQRSLVRDRWGKWRWNWINCIVFTPSLVLGWAAISFYLAHAK